MNSNLILIFVLIIKKGTHQTTKNKMSVYRFKVTFEDNDEIYREIEIKSVQTFEDFHFVILQSIGFDTIHNASFFISDDYWRKEMR